MDILSIAKSITTFGINNVWNAVAIVIILSVLKFGFNPSKQSKEYQELMKKQAEEHTNTLKNLNTTLTTISTKMEGWDRNVFEELKALENKMKNYELMLQHNLIQYVRLAFKSISIDDNCIKNLAHDKRLCPYPENDICECIERFKALVFHELDLYIIDENKKDRIRNILTTYAQPESPIKDYLSKMQKEVENAIK